MKENKSPQDIPNTQSGTPLIGNNQSSIDGDFKVYYNAWAPGVVHLFIIVCFAKKNDVLEDTEGCNRILCEYYYIFKNTSKNNNATIYKGIFEYPVGVYGDDNKHIFDCLLMQSQIEIVQNFIIPELDNYRWMLMLVFKSFDYFNSILYLKPLEMPQSALVICEKSYEKEIEKLKNNTNIPALKKYLNNISHIIFNEGQLL
jgi:hypothetical protein